MKKWFEKIMDAIKKLLGKKDPVKPEEGKDVIPISSITWLGGNYSAAQMTAVLTSSHLSNHTHTLSEAPPTDWPTKVVKVLCQGIVCLFYERDGSIVGGKYDWLRPNQKAKGLENIRDKNYGGHTMPAQGSKVWTCFVSVDEKQRSRIVEVTRS